MMIKMVIQNGSYYVSIDFRSRGEGKQYVRNAIK